MAPTAVETTSVQPAPSDGMDYAGWVLLGGGLLLVAGGATFAMTRRPRRRDAAYMAREQTVSTSLSASEPTPAIAAFERPVTPTPVVVRNSAVTAPGGNHHAALEAMVAEAPSEANPFQSRRNRLRRANYLLRTGQASGDGPTAAVRQDEAAMPARDRWTTMAFGGNRATNVSWRPATR